MIELQFEKEVVNETFLTMPAGETHWVQWRTMALYDDGGNDHRVPVHWIRANRSETDPARAGGCQPPAVALSQELIKSQEEERIMVARFLHDQVLGELGEMARSPDESVDEKKRCSR